MAAELKHPQGMIPAAIVQVGVEANLVSVCRTTEHFVQPNRLFCLQPRGARRQTQMK